MKFNILQANVSDSNGRIYTSEVLQQIANQINNNTVLGTLEPNDESLIDLSKISHEVKNAIVVKDILSADINPIETPKGKILQEKFLNNLERWRDSYCFKCNGTGLIDKDQKITNYEIISIDLIPINKAKPKQ